MKSLWLEKEIHYDGSQLRSLFAYMNHDLMGDSILSWAGSCEVTPTHMVDGEDLLAGAEIRGGKMLHFIVEKFGCDLFTMVSLQRLFAATALVSLVRMSPRVDLTSKLRREGDDLWVEDRKLSISIATVSPVSALMHFAMNIENKNTPVKTLSLRDLEMDAGDFARQLSSDFCEEIQSMELACCKVKWVP